MYDRPGHIPERHEYLRSCRCSTNRAASVRTTSWRRCSTPTTRPAVITYCGGGIAASSNAFVMTRLGFTDVAVYIASLQEWAADPDLPMETAPAE